MAANDLDDRDPAPDQLLDGDEWASVVATGDYVGQRVERFEMADVEVRGGRWSGVTIEGLRAFDVRFVGCDLAGFVLQEEVTLRKVTFENCRMSGAVFAGAHMREVRFVDCPLDDTNFRMIDAEKVSFVGCRLAVADFHAAQVKTARFDRCDLRGVDLTKARFTEVDLRGSELLDIRGADALRGSTIDSVQIVSLARSLAAALDITILDDDE